MVGGIVLRECLNHPEVGQVTAIVRRPTRVKHEKLREVIHSDFSNYSSIEHHFENQDIAQFCIGVYTGKVPRDEFRIITVDYTKAFGKMYQKYNPRGIFCFLSGAGADQTEKSRMMFAQDKGIAENFLIRQNYHELYIFRPAYIYPVTPRKEPNFTYSLSRKLYPLLKTIYPNGVITSEHLAKAMFQVGLKGASKTVFENVDIKAISVE